MKRYRQTSQPVGNGPDLPRNPIPWTTKLLGGLFLILMVVFLILLLFRKEESSLFTQVLALMKQQPENPGTSLPGSTSGSPFPTPTFPPGSAWLSAIKISTIYSGPGEENHRIGILEGGDRARIVGGRGWVSDAQVQTYDTGNVSELSAGEAAPTVAEAVPQSDTPMLSSIANANIRSGPGLEFERIGMLSQGQEAEILGQDPDGFWWLIKAPNVEGERGWVSRDYVIARNAGEVPVIGTSSIQFGAIPTPAPGKPSLKVASVINIRSGPGTNFAIIGKLAPEQTAEIVGISPDGAWWAIKIPSAQNQRGWVSAEFVAVENAEGVPVIR
jgi:uncharacterized protein YraI